MCVSFGRTWVTVRMGLASYARRRVLVLLYLLLLLALLARWTYRATVGQAIRYDRNGRYWAVGWRLAIVGLLVPIEFLLIGTGALFQALAFPWMRAPGTLPPPEHTVVRPTRRGRIPAFESP